MTFIAIALDYNNLKIAKSVVTSLIEFDIHTRNPVAEIHPADANKYVLVIDLVSPNVSIVEYRDFDKLYDGKYNSQGFTRVTPKF